MKNKRNFKLQKYTLVLLFISLFPGNIIASKGDTMLYKGITGNPFLDYFLLPFLMTIIIFIIFKKHFVSLTKKIESTKEEKNHENN